MTGQLFPALSNQRGGLSAFTTAVRDARSQESEFRPAQPGASGEMVKQLVFRARPEVVKQQLMPDREVFGAFLALVAGLVEIETRVYDS